MNNPVNALMSYSFRVPRCVPFWNSDTYRLLFRSILSGRVMEGPEVAQLNHVLAQFFGVPEVIACGSGKAAIELALRAGRVSKGSEVVIPTFCCTSVLLPILAVGAAPVLADVGEELNLTVQSVEAELTSQTKAIIVPHLFGNPTDIDRIEDLARGRGILLIDDAAQAFGATLNGRPLGTFGDAGLVSFGNGKICFGTGGGVLVSQSPEFFDHARRISLSRGNMLEVIGHSLSTVVWRRWRRFSLPLWAILARLGWLETKPRHYIRQAMANLHGAVALTLVKTLKQNLSARRERVAAYQRLLSGNSRLELIPHRPGSACLTQVVKVHSKPSLNMASKLVASLRSAGYEVGGSYVPLHLINEYRQFARRRLPNSESAWEHLVELPCEPEVSLTAIERISAIVQKGIY